MKTYLFKCADCNTAKVFKGRSDRAIYELARAEGWAIDRDNKNKWCPNCAELHRHVGRRGIRSFVQIKLDVK